MLLLTLFIVALLQQHIQCAPLPQESSFEGYYYHHPVFENDEAQDSVHEEEEPPLLKYKEDPDPRLDEMNLCCLDNKEEYVKDEKQNYTRGIAYGDDAELDEAAKRHDNATLGKIVDVLKTLSLDQLSRLQTNLTKYLSDFDQASRAANDTNDLGKAVSHLQQEYSSLATNVKNDSKPTNGDLKFSSDVTDEHPIKSDHAENQPIKSYNGDDKPKPIKSDHADDHQIKLNHADDKPIKSDHGDDQTIKSDHADDQPIKSNHADDHQFKSDHGKSDKSALKLHPSSTIAQLLHQEGIATGSSDDENDKQNSINKIEKFFEHLTANNSVKQISQLKISDFKAAGTYTKDDEQAFATKILELLKVFNASLDDEATQHAVLKGGLSRFKNDSIDDYITPEETSEKKSESESKTNNLTTDKKTAAGNNANVTLKVTFQLNVDKLMKAAKDKNKEVISGLTSNNNTASTKEDVESIHKHVYKLDDQDGSNKLKKLGFQSSHSVPNEPVIKEASSAVYPNTTPDVQFKKTPMDAMYENLLKLTPNQSTDGSDLANSDSEDSFAVPADKESSKLNQKSSSKESKDKLFDALEAIDAKDAIEDASEKTDASKLSDSYLDMIRKIEHANSIDANKTNALSSYIMKKIVNVLSRKVNNMSDTSSGYAAFWDGYDKKNKSEVYSSMGEFLKILKVLAENKYGGQDIDDAISQTKYANQFANDDSHSTSKTSPSDFGEIHILKDASSSEENDDYSMSKLKEFLKAWHPGGAQNQKQATNEAKEESSDSKDDKTAIESNSSKPPIFQTEEDRSLAKFNRLLDLLKGNESLEAANWKDNTYLHMSVGRFEELFKNLFPQQEMKHVKPLATAYRNEDLKDIQNLKSLRLANHSKAADVTKHVGRENVHNMTTISSSDPCITKFQKLLKLLTFKEMLKHFSHNSNEDESTNIKLGSAFLGKVETLLKLLAFNRIFEDWNGGKSTDPTFAEAAANVAYSKSNKHEPPEAQIFIRSSHPEYRSAIAKYRAMRRSKPEGLCRF